MAVCSSAQRITDFVWAVRLAKISKGLIDRKWTHETISRGATFAVDDNEADKGRNIVDALRREGLEVVLATDVQIGSDIFVIGTESGEVPGAET